MPSPELRPPVGMPDLVALTATVGLVGAVAIPVAAELGAVGVPSDAQALQRLLETVPQPVPRESPAAGTWTQFVTSPLVPVTASQSSPDAPSKTVQSNQVSGVGIPARNQAVVAAGPVLNEARTGPSGLMVHRLTDKSLVRFRASTSSLQRLARTATRQYRGGLHRIVEDTPLEIPTPGGRTSWKASRDLILAGELPHPDLVRVESFVAAVDAGTHKEVTDHRSPVVRVARADDDPSAIWLQVGLQPKPSPKVRRAPLDLVILVDTSGSMASTAGLDHARAAIVQTVQNLRPRDRLSILSFNGGAADLVTGARGVGVETVARALSDLHADGATDAASGLRAGLERIHLRRARRGRLEPHIVLFTDGDLMATGRQEWQAAAEEIRAAGVTLTTVAIGGMWADAEPLERELAQLGGVHLAARDGQEASLLLRGALWPQDSEHSPQPQLRLTLDPEQVAYAEIMGWDASRPSLPLEGPDPTETRAASDGSTTLLRLHLRSAQHTPTGDIGFILAESVGERPSTRIPIKVPVGDIPALIDVPDLAVAVLAAQLADALRRLDAEALSTVANEVSRVQRPDHPEDAALLKVARRAAFLAALPVNGSDDPTLKPSLEPLLTQLETECFSDLTDRRGPRPGRLTIRARFIGGRIAGVRILEDTVEDRMLNACVVNRVQDWPPPTQSGGDWILPLTWRP